ncbi:C40 family peptidase [Kitasatospora sp. NPDC048239]|uniref:C40 family peptidase n=1 Tax=Kitasatospora sp. NPDC048239 TaxID=3364046 RepID=UPI003712B8A2
MMWQQARSSSGITGRRELHDLGRPCLLHIRAASPPQTVTNRTIRHFAGALATANRPITQADLQPGDLLFWRRNNGCIYHVALYTTDGNMVSAPKTGDVVKHGPLSEMPTADFAGATRP